ncbi:MAG: alkaline phosphatase family protein [Terriglobales bacterium]
MMLYRSPLRIFVLVDALGAALPGVDALLPAVLTHRAALRTVLGFSSGAVPALLTGLPPAETGHWNLFYYNPAQSPFAWLRHWRFLPSRARDHRVARRLLKEVGRRWLGLGPLFECAVPPSLLPWFDWVEKKNIYAPGGIRGARSAFDDWEDQGLRYRIYTYRHAADAAILQCAQAEVRTGAADVFFLYLSELDHFLHFHRGEPAAIRERLRCYGAELQALFHAARQRDPRAQFCIFSDHGMAPVRGRADVAGAVAGLGLAMPRDYLAVYDSTMARFWFFNHRARQLVRSVLSEQPHGRLLQPAELRREGVFFPDHRFGETIFLLDPGWLIAESHFNGAGWNPTGMHGYHPDDPDSDAIFLANFQPRAELGDIRDLHAVLTGAAPRSIRTARDAVPPAVVAPAPEVEAL